MGQPRPRFRLFSVFSNKHYNFYNKSKCPSSMLHQDSNPQTFKHELSPITTSSGHLPSIRR